MSETNQTTREPGWEAVAINASFTQTGIKFTASNADTLKAFGREVNFDDDGQPFALYDQEILPLSDALSRFAYDNRQHCDGRTLPRLGSGKGRPGVASKADYTPAQASAYINEFGLSSWEKLPSTNSAGKEVLSKSDYYRLPRHEKIRLLDVDPDYFSKLPNTPPSSLGGRVNGSYINHQGLAKQASLRPKRLGN